MIAHRFGLWFGCRRGHRRSSLGSGSNGHFGRTGKRSMALQLFDAGLQLFHFFYSFFELGDSLKQSGQGFLVGIGMRDNLRLPCGQPRNHGQRCQQQHGQAR